MSDETSQFVIALLRLPVINRLGIAQRPREFERFLKFAIVGAIGMVVDLTTLTIAAQVFRLPLALAVAIGFSIAVSATSPGTASGPFPESRERPIRGQLAQFFVINLIGLGINEVVVGASPRLPPGGARPAGLHRGKIIAIGIVLFWNYFVNRRWTYKGIE